MAMDGKGEDYGLFYTYQWTFCIPTEVLFGNGTELHWRRGVEKLVVYLRQGLCHYNNYKC